MATPWVEESPGHRTDLVEEDRAPREAMGPVPGTISRRNESQAPIPRAVDATWGRVGIAGTMPCPARPEERQKLTCAGGGPGTPG